MDSKNNFLQLHFLTAYPPSNLNRDDLGRPKTALYGGALRLRVSSQSLKRAWRTSELFESKLKGHLGIRTKRFGDLVLETLKKSLDEKKAAKIAGQLASAFGKVDEGNASTEQLVHITPDEKTGLEKLTALLATEKREPTKEELEGLVGKATGASDVGLFGRMLAAKPGFNMEASCQVAHAISVHKVAVEDDYFTAVDDLKKSDEDLGAGHVGTQEFAAAVLYHYVCVDRRLLLENLGGDEALLKLTLEALIEACLTVPPNGKQGSFASRARAHYALVEKGSSQPRSLAAAFLKPVAGEDLLSSAVAAISDTKRKLDTVYGDAPEAKSFDANAGSGTMKEVAAFFAAV
jgi:CRISPR system Cascade subunit CasC